MYSFEIRLYMCANLLRVIKLYHFENSLDLVDNERTPFTTIGQ